MSTRKTKAMAVHISSGVFKTLEDATKEANSIKIWLQRLCERYSYSCRAIIGISQNDPKTGCIAPKLTGKRGRPQYIFIRTTKIMKPTKTEAHIHIVLYANPADMICSLLSKHLNNKYKKKIVWTYDCAKYINNATNYVLKQSIKLRKVDFDKNGILNNDKIGFYKAIQIANDKLGTSRIKFTLPSITEQSKRPVVSRVEEVLNKHQKLQCNNPYINYDLNNIHYNLKDIDLYIKVLTIYSLYFIKERYIPP